LKPERTKGAPVAGGDRLLQRIYTRLGCQGRPPHFVVEFYPYANLTHTVRFTKEVARVRLSDVLRTAPIEVVEAAAALLLARAYRRTAPEAMAECYRNFCRAPATLRQLAELRRRRCRPMLREADRYDLGRLFEQLNRRYFAGTLHRPQLGWSVRSWRVQLGAFDPALDRIVLNRRLDAEDVPRYAVEYVLYHEMLHVKHPGEMARCGLRVHSRAFRAEEKRFARYEEARKWLERMR
jgi:predicted metal-dependent hydrolase